MWNNLFVTINQWYIDASALQVLLTFAGIWTAMSIVTTICTFTLNAAELWCKSRTEDYQITAFALSRYEAHELGFWGMLVLWPLVFIVVVPWASIELIGKFFDVFFIRPNSTFRIIPQWCSLAGIAKMLNAGRKRND